MSTRGPCTMGTHEYKPAYVPSAIQESKHAKINESPGSENKTKRDEDKGHGGYGR